MVIFFTYLKRPLIFSGRFFIMIVRVQQPEPVSAKPEIAATFNDDEPGEMREQVFVAIEFEQ